MGYRKLLKTYMAKLREMAGSNYVEEMAQSKLVSGRELGELRSIAAELKREECEESMDRQQSNLATGPIHDE